MPPFGPEDVDEASPLQFAITKLVTDKDLSEARALIESSPLLLTDEADRILQDACVLLSKDHQKSQAALDHVGRVLGLIRRCREVGTAETFAEMAAGKPLDTRRALYPKELSSSVSRVFKAWDKFELSGDGGALKEAIKGCQDVLAHSGFEQSRLLFRVHMLDLASAAMLTSFEREDCVDELTSAIQILTRAALEAPKGFIDWPMRTWRLGWAHQARFKLLRHDADLDHARKEIDALLDAVGTSLPLDGVEEQMGPWLRGLYRETTDLEWLDREIRLYERKLSSLVPQSKDYTPLSVNIGNALRVRYEHRNDPVDLARALEYLEDAAPRMPPSRWRSTALGGLAYARLLWFRSTRDLGDLEKAIAVFEEALSAKEVITNYNTQGVENELLEALLEYRTLTGSDAVSARIEKLRGRVKENSVRVLLEALDKKILAEESEADNAGSELKAGLRLFGQNKGIRRLRYEARRNRRIARIILVVSALGSLLLFGAASIAWLLFDSYLASMAAAAVGVAILYFAWRISAPALAQSAATEELLDMERQRFAAWDDVDARQIVADSRERGKPFALFLRGFEVEAADRPLDLDAKEGPRYIQVLTPDLGPVERKLKAALATHLPAIAIANPTDLLNVGKQDQIPRMVLPTKEKEWLRVVSALADAAILIVVACREFSPGVETELEMLAEHGHARKTIVVIPAEGESDEKTLFDAIATMRSTAFGSQGASVSPPFDKYARATKSDLRLRLFPNVILSSELSWETIEQTVRVY